MALSTYAAGAQSIAGVAGDILVITGSATTTVRVKRITISGTATTAQVVGISVIRRSSLNSGGLASPLGAVPYDTLSNAPQAQVDVTLSSYSSFGTQVGSLMKSVEGFINTAGESPFIAEFTWGDDIAQCAILRGVNQCLCLNLASALTSASINCDIEWTETPPNSY
jgi:hypothetical protein